MTSKYLRKGRSGARGGGGDSRFLTIKADDSIVVALMKPMSEMISVDLHSWWDINPAPHLVCLGSDCPSCKLGHEASYKAYLPVLTREGEAKVLATGITVVRQLEALEDEIGDLTGQVFKVSRKGSTWNNTKYTVVLLGKKAPVADHEAVDIEAALGPLTFEEQVEVLEKAGVDCADIMPTKPAKKTTAKKATKATKKEPEAEEEEAKSGSAPWDEDEDSEADEDWAEI